jgi:hypothetical protein
MPLFPDSFLRRLLSRVALAMGLCLMLVSYAAAPERIEVAQVSLDPYEDGWAVNAQFNLALKARLEEALERGLPLYFVVEFELTRPRWYWFNEKTANASLTYRLSYHALTREYRLSTGSLQLGFSSLAEAIGVMTRVRDWKVLDQSAIEAGETYIAAIRMRFDTSQLPKPFQLNALTSRDWTLESDWKRFSFEVSR